MEIEIAMSLLKDDDLNTAYNTIDLHYNKLKCEITVLNRNSEEWKTILKYVKNTHGQTHSNFEIEVEEIFVINRKGEEERFSEKLSKDKQLSKNRKLLWHGSRTTNFGSILSQVN